MYFREKAAHRSTDLPEQPSEDEESKDVQPAGNQNLEELWQLHEMKIQNLIKSSKTL